MTVNKTNQIFKLQKSQLMTSWSEKASLGTPLPEYPRPHLRRDDWINLNGLWDYAIRTKQIKKVKSFDGKILVPFPVESALSGVKRKLNHNQRLWYQRFFNIPKNWVGNRILLHFGAVDFETTVWINNNLVGSHIGGYDPFTFDITNYLEFNSQNELLIVVWDPTDKGAQNHGKQSLNPFIIFYTAVSGIWQTVWIENVSDECYIQNICTIPDIDNETVELTTIIRPSLINSKEFVIKAVVKDKQNEISTKTAPLNDRLQLDVPNPKLWSPESPFLYDLVITIEREGVIIDTIKSYFGMRKISLEKDEDDIPRIKLNNKTIFQYGLLDQGYWPDGLYTAPTDNALKFDIKKSKELGFNLIRKHVKVEPARWYYHCDKLGILVWQDIPNGGKFSYLPYILDRFYSSLKRGRKNKNEKENYYKELNAIVESLKSYPCIVTWVPFNEGWGQFDTKKVVNVIQQLDSSRLIDAASGWFDEKAGHIKDVHNYPDPKLPPLETNRALVLGEFGGLGYKIKNHTWVPKKAWNVKRIYFGYNESSNRQEFFEKYNDLIKTLKSMITQGLCAAIYTQTTDVEGEINGLITYDREIIKVDMDKIRGLNRELYK